MNNSHFTIHVVGIFIGQGGQGPPWPQWSSANGQWEPVFPEWGTAREDFQELVDDIRYVTELSLDGVVGNLFGEESD